MTEDTPVDIEEIEVIEPNGNVISFNKNKISEEEVVNFTFKDFRERSKEFEEDIDAFVFIGNRKDGEATVSAKADNNMHLYWMVKRFLRHLEDNIFG